MTQDHDLVEPGPDGGSVDEPDVPPASAELRADISDSWSWASAAAGIPQIGGIDVRLSETIGHARLSVRVLDHDSEVGSTVVHDGRLEAGEHEFGSRAVPLAAAYMARLDERGSAKCVVDLTVPGGPGADAVVLAKVEQEIDIDPRDMWRWDATPRIPSDAVPRLTALISRSLLASFVRPNHPAVADVAREAAEVRRRTVGDPSFYAFQIADPDEAATQVEQSVTAIYEALRARNIAYSEPPPRWDYRREGQRIRDHGAVAAAGLGTCMDTTVLMAAVLEHVGLYPVLVLIPGHIFIGYWRRDPYAGKRTPDWYPTGPVTDNIEQIVELVQGRFLGLIETTTLTTGLSTSAEDARTRAIGGLQSGLQRGHVMIIDVAAARQARVSPLPAVRDRDDGAIEVIEYRPGGAPQVSTVVEPEATSAPGRRFVDTHPPRYRTWKSALISLDARSALLNLGTGPSSQPVVLPAQGLGILEDRLHQDVEFDLLSGFDLPEVYLAREKPNAVLLDAEDQLRLLDQRRVYVQRLGTTRSSQGPITPAKFTSEIRSMARRAKEGRDERGMNPLFLTLGLLRWPYKPGRMADAPIILVPVTLTLRPRSKQFTLSIDSSSHASPNYALIEWLRREHDLDIPDLVEPQTDKAGLDVDAVLASVRKAVAAKGLPFDVAPEARLALLDLAAFRMWRDLNNHADGFMANPLVRHLVHSPTEPFDDPVHDESSPDLDLEAIEAPVPADAAQLTAVAWARHGRTFVLQGPPGTGKSQTITNMIAECVRAGMKLLFVAEKQTALSVVQRRLDAIGLSPFTLNLHHEGSNAAEVRAQLKASLAARVTPDPIAMQNAKRRMRNAHFQLGKYPADLHARNAAGLSAYSARDELIVLGDGPTADVPEGLVARDADAVEAVRESLREVQYLSAAAGVRPDHPWRFAGPGTGGVLDVEATATAVQQVLDARRWVESIDGPLREAIESAATTADLEHLAAGADPRLPTGDELRRVLEPGWENSARALIDECRRTIDGWTARLDGFGAGVLAIDLGAVKSALTAAGTGNVFNRRARREAAMEPLRPYAPPDRALDAQWVLPFVDELIHLKQVDDGVRASLASIAGVALPPGFASFEADSLVPVVARIDELAGASRALRDPDSFANRAKQLSVDGALAPHRDRLAGMAKAWGRLTGLVTARSADIDVWRAGAGIMAAVAKHARTWQDDVTHERLLPLQRWVTLVDRLTPLEAAGLHRLRSDLLGAALPVDQAEEAFARGVAAASLRERLRATGLDRFDAVAHDRRVHDYADAESQVREQWVTSGPADLLESRGGGGHAFSGAATGALARELEKQRNRLGTRALLHRYGAAIQQATPIILTSPSSAVDLIEPGEMQFDLAIFDEASQITVPEAIGTMGRATAVVVVGDSKQMPPTRRVGASPDADEDFADDDIDEIVEDQESILTECELARVPTLKLSWHYRSQDEALIAFSNAAYYDGELSSFPTPTLLSTATGVEFRRIDGRYIRAGSGDTVQLAPSVVAGRNTNPDEARAIVDEVVALIDAAPDGRPSIGIVTFNEQQRVLIEDRLRASDDPRIAAVMDEAVMGPTGVLFVKALEQVQGDERDTVLFSVAFSKQPNGRIPLNFGRLSQMGGERRLNVAVTRARRKNIVFCSFEPDELDAENSSYDGVKDLKRFLKFARGAARAEDAAALATDRVDIRDRHRDQVADALRGHGLHVMTDVGLSDFRLDLVLSRPERPDRVVLPVLLDGEAWHSRPTVSDRDVLPVEVLTNLMGWPSVARIWWPMWQQNQDRAIEDLIAEFEAAEEVLDEADAAAAEVVDDNDRTEQEPASSPPASRVATVATQTSPVESMERLDLGTFPSETYPLSFEQESTEPSRVSPADPTARPVLQPYQAWSRPDVAPVDQSSPEQIADVLEDIVRTEGPVLAWYAYRRYVHASGGKRVGSAIKRTLNQATARLVRAGRILQIDDDIPGQIDTTLYYPGTSAVVVRELGDRWLEAVPRSEVAALIERSGWDVDEQATKRKVLAAYGRTSLTKAASEYLEWCMRYTYRR